MLLNLFMMLVSLELGSDAILDPHSDWENRRWRSHSFPSSPSKLRLRGILETYDSSFCMTEYSHRYSFSTEFWQKASTRMFGSDTIVRIGFPSSPSKLRLRGILEETYDTIGSTRAYWAYWWWFIFAAFSNWFLRNLGYWWWFIFAAFSNWVLRNSRQLHSWHTLVTLTSIDSSKIHFTYSFYIFFWQFSNTVPCLELLARRPSKNRGSHIVLVAGVRRPLTWRCILALSAPGDGRT